MEHDLRELKNEHVETKGKYLKEWTSANKESRFLIKL
jgi:hypothetical protein